MDIYQRSLFLLTFANISALFCLQRRKQKASSGSWLSQAAFEKEDGVSRLYHRFMAVYVLVIASDWLQGPFFWAVYREDHGLPEATVGKLSATGFAAGAFATLFIGSLSDRYGRKKACMAYCVLSAISCASVLATDIRLLFAGRALGGISTTLLYSAFEPWLLGEIRCLHSDTQEQNDITSRIFAHIAIANGIVAIPSGVLSEVLVRKTASIKAPFMASIVALCIAAVLILANWSENYGEQSSNSSGSYKLSFLRDGSFQRLALIAFSFEATIYTVVYFWPAAISSARSSHGILTPPPFGLIFANFMSSMMLGSTLFNLGLSIYNWGVIPRHVCRYTLLTAAFSLLVVILSRHEAVHFTALCIYEASVGAYNPMIASVKSHVVPPQHQSQAYGLLRLPTNVFVVVALSSVQDGSLYRNATFFVGAVLLILGSALSSTSAGGAADERAKRIDDAGEKQPQLV